MKTGLLTLLMILLFVLAAFFFYCAIAALFTKHFIAAVTFSYGVYSQILLMRVALKCILKEAAK